MQEAGFMGMMVDLLYGGGGMDTLSYVLAIEEISKIDAACSVAMSVNNSLVCSILQTFGSEDQKDQYLRPLASGKWLGAFSLSEPQAGSDAIRQKTTAIPEGDHYILNGVKNWVTNGKYADVYIIMAVSNPENSQDSINAFIVP